MAADGGAPGRKPVELMLYLADNAPRSLQALANLREILKEAPQDRFTLQVVDALSAPAQALEDGVFMTPLLVRVSEPRTVLTGLLDDRRQVLGLLEGGDGAAEVARLRPRVEHAARQVAQIKAELQALLGDQADMVIDPQDALPVILPSAQYAVWDEARNFRRIFEEAPMGIALVSADFRFLRANARLASITGYSREELLEMGLSDITGGEGAGGGGEMQGKLQQCRIGLCEGETPFRRKGGETVWLRLSVAFIRDGAGTRSYYLVMVQNITNVKKTEAELSRYHGQLEDLVRGRTEELAAANAKLRKEIAERLEAEEAVRALNEELESRVRERTAELEESNRQLEMMNNFFVGRELRMAELKRDIAKLEQEVRSLKLQQQEVSVKQ